MSTSSAKAPMSGTHQPPATVAVRMAISRWVAELQANARDRRHPDAHRATPARANAHAAERPPSLGAHAASASAS